MAALDIGKDQSASAVQSTDELKAPRACEKTLEQDPTSHISVEQRMKMEDLRKFDILVIPSVDHLIKIKKLARKYDIEALSALKLLPMELYPTYESSDWKTTNWTSTEECMVWIRHLAELVKQMSEEIEQLKLQVAQPRSRP